MWPRAQCRSESPRSSTSAFSLSRSTVARRTVQTLIGSYVALSTSTRPPDQRLPPVAGPCRRWSTVGTDPSGAGIAVLIGASRKCSRRIGRQSAVSGGRVRAQDLDGLRLCAERVDGLRDRGLAGAAAEVGEEHVVTE